MAESLNQVKDRLKVRFLGKGGIHGLGISKAQNAIRVYVSPAKVGGADPVLAEIEKAAGPYKVIVVEEDRPSAH